ncbi:hypothetical protein M983_1075 [Proteus myxofaciens ATCC 19692]|uniref:Uncharacterized protein n=1 Tax=Proteus myxofaciens ATCC 19692 TaxID=1354337 RepID=A0A198GCF8_9GAMM|nr:hypothetical protein M983_1075 [Proteus myxofaciens ATCC 19692]
MFVFICLFYHQISSENAQRVAQFLEDNPNVDTIYYPRLTSFPQYHLAKMQMRLAGGDDNV